MPRVLRAVDLFCGAGGTTQGAHQSGAAQVVCAVNHWKVAVRTHSANFPGTLHINSRLDQVNPGECPKIDLLLASPECTHHSRARGGRPTSDQQRSGAWDLMRWIEYHRPTGIIVENVPEFREWGPVAENGRPLVKYRGRFFSAWVDAIRAAGYRVDDRCLNAADFGAATSRTRLFIVARKGNRGVRWPEPTHAQRSGGELPGFEMKRWRAAAEIIDWSIPCPSVFARRHPLRDNTLLRIEAGLRRFVGPFVVELRQHLTARGIDNPLGTITAKGKHHGVAVPFGMMLTHGGRELTLGSPLPTITTAHRGEQAVAIPFVSSYHGGPDGANRNYSACDAVPTLDTSNRYGIAVPFIKPNFNERDGQKPRSHDLDDPLPTVTSRGAGDLIVPFVLPNEGFFRGNQPRSADNPIPTITSRGGGSICVPIIVTYYANGKAYPVTEPLCTISTRDRCGLAYAIVETAASIEPRTEGERKLWATMQELGVADVGFRMLVNSELSAAQGFPADYVFHGNKGDVTKQIGNSVAPDVAEALTRTMAEAA